jgi:hypothetical protein
MVNNSMLIISKVVNFFMITSGKQIRDHVVNFFVDIHRWLGKTPFISYQ